MKSYKKAFFILLAVLGCVFLVSLPFGIKILREEGMAGVFERKRTLMNRYFPAATPAVDKAEKMSKEMGLR